MRSLPPFNAWDVNVTTLPKAISVKSEKESVAGFADLLAGVGTAPEDTSLPRGKTGTEDVTVEAKPTHEAGEQKATWLNDPGRKSLERKIALGCPTVRPPHQTGLARKGPARPELTIGVLSSTASLPPIPNATPMAVTPPTNGTGATLQQTRIKTAPATSVTEAIPPRAIEAPVSAVAVNQSALLDIVSGSPDVATDGEPTPVDSRPGIITDSALLAASTHANPVTENKVSSPARRDFSGAAYEADGSELAATAPILQAVKQDDHSVISVHLSLPHIGNLQVRVTGDETGATSLSISAEREATLRALIGDQAQLHDVLQNAGVRQEDRTIDFSLLQAGSRGANEWSGSGGNDDTSRRRTTEPVDGIGLPAGIDQAEWSRSPAEDRSLNLINITA